MGGPEPTGGAILERDPAVSLVPKFLREELL